MAFKTTILLARKTATGIEVPPEVVEALNGGKKPAVVARVNDYEYRTTVASMGGRFLIPFSSEHRAASGLEAGDAVTVDLRLDTEVREVAVPQDLVEALSAAPAAQAAFEALSYSRKRWFVLGVEGAKTAETREKRIRSAVAELSGGGG